MKNLKFKRPNEKVVANALGERVGDINNNITPAQTEICVAPKMDMDGAIIGFEPAMDKIKNEERTINIFGKQVTLTGTLYGVAKGENGKYGYTFFMPDFPAGSEEEYMKSLFKTAETLLQLVTDMTYWSMPARILSKVSNEGNCNSDMQEYIGEKYAMNLISDDTVKFSRAMFLQYIYAEKDIFKELGAMVSGGASDHTVKLSSNDGEAYVEKNEAIQVVAFEERNRKFGANSKKFVSLGGKETQRPETKFGLKKDSALNNAGKSALNLKK